MCSQQHAIKPTPSLGASSAHSIHTLVADMQTSAIKIFMEVKVQIVKASDIISLFQSSSPSRAEIDEDETTRECEDVGNE